MNALRLLLAAVATLLVLLPTAASAAPGERSCVGADEAPRASTTARAQAAVRCLVDAEREARGLPTLRPDDRLDRAAAWHAQDMRQRSYFDHDAPRPAPHGTHPWDRVGDAGYRWASVAENIARGQRTPREVVAAWFASEGHCRNLLAPASTEIGVAVVVGGNGPWWVQNLARPRGDEPARRDGRDACDDGGLSVRWARSGTPVKGGSGDGERAPLASAESGSGRLTIALRLRGGRSVVSGRAPRGVDAVRVTLRRGGDTVVREAPVRDGRYVLDVATPGDAGLVRAAVKPA